MKRWISLLMTAAVLLSLAACGQAGSQAGGAQEGEIVELEPAAVQPTEEAIMEENVSVTEKNSPPEPKNALLAAAVYPETIPCPREEDYRGTDGRLSEDYFLAYNSWADALEASQERATAGGANIASFLQKSLPRFLSNTEGKNLVYSPLNVYIALAMLAELTEGESRKQVLSLLGAEDLEAVRTSVRDLWEGTYRDDGTVTTLLASSLWLSDRVSFHQSTMDTLAERYYASSYRGTMGSPAFNRALQSWINEQTGELLEKQASELEMDARTILALVSTIYFKAAWVTRFSEDRTEPAVFHSPSEDMTADFLHQSGAREYYWGERFSAVSQPLENGGAMWLLLPDEGVTPEELLLPGEALEFLLSQNKPDWEKQKYLRVNLSLPKFDVSSNVDLIPGLTALGVRDVFDYTVSDFSPMTADTDEVYVSQAEHAARVLIDEDGCTAAAYTVLMTRFGAAMPPEEEIDFILDRPFVFCITASAGLPLFVGIVNLPVED